MGGETGGVLTCFSKCQPRLRLVQLLLFTIVIVFIIISIINFAIIFFPILISYFFCPNFFSRYFMSLVLLILLQPSLTTTFFSGFLVRRTNFFFPESLTLSLSLLLSRFQPPFSLTLSFVLPIFLSLVSVFHLSVSFSFVLPFFFLLASSLLSSPPYPNMSYFHPSLYVHFSFHPSFIPSSFFSSLHFSYPYSTRIFLLSFPHYFCFLLINLLSPSPIYTFIISFSIPTLYTSFYFIVPHWHGEILLRFGRDGGGARCRVLQTCAT